RSCRDCFRRSASTLTRLLRRRVTGFIRPPTRAGGVIVALRLRVARRPRDGTARRRHSSGSPTPAVDAPDGEAVPIKLLGGEGPGSTKVPADRQGGFVRLSVTGGSGGVLLDRPSVLVECWAPSTVSACALARRTRQKLHDSRFAVVDGWQVYGIDCAYPVYFPDETSDRYQFLANVGIRRHNLISTLLGRRRL